MWGLLGYACFRASKGVGRALLSLPTVQSLFENIRTPSVWPFSKRHRLFSSEIRMSHWTPVALTTGWWLGRLGGRLKANIISISYEISNVGGSLWLALSHLLNPLCTCVDTELYCQRNRTMLSFSFLILKVWPTRKLAAAGFPTLSNLNWMKFYFAVLFFILVGSCKWLMNFVSQQSSIVIPCKSAFESMTYSSHNL